MRERLQVVIAVALAVAPHRVKAAYAERRSIGKDEATRRIAEAVTAAILVGFDVSGKGEGRMIAPADKQAAQSEAISAVRR